MTSCSRVQESQEEVFVGLRSTRKFGFPRPWRPAKSRLNCPPLQNYTAKWRQILYITVLNAVLDAVLDVLGRLGSHSYSTGAVENKKSSEAPTQALRYCRRNVLAGDEQAILEPKFSNQLQLRPLICKRLNLAQKPSNLRNMNWYPDVSSFWNLFFWCQ